MDKQTDSDNSIRFNALETGLCNMGLLQYTEDNPGSLTYVCTRHQCSTAVHSVKNGWRGWIMKQQVNRPVLRWHLTQV